MATTTEIKERDANGALVVSLRDLLSAVAPEFGDACWRILELEAVGAERSNIGELTARINRERCGLEMSTVELRQLAERLVQVINVIAVVPADRTRPPEPPLNKRFYDACRLVLECVDGDVWRVTVDDQPVHERLRSLIRRMVEGQ